MSPSQSKPQPGTFRRVLNLQAWTIFFGVASAAGAVFNVKVVTDAGPDYSDMDSLVRSITSRWQRPDEQCWALFYWTHLGRRQTSPMIVHGLECTDPIRQFNDYGFTMCSTVAGVNCTVWQAMGYPVRFWDITAHTVSEVQYDGRWHIYDNSMSALYTLCDGKTIAGVEGVGAVGSCDASGGRAEPGHIARYHCLYADSANGFLTGADCARDLEQEYRCFNPNSLKHRYYYTNQDHGHRYVLNLRPGETYTRYHRSLGDERAFYVPNGGKDPESTNPRYRLRGNGLWTFEPRLDRDSLREGAWQIRDCKSVEPSGVAPAVAGKAGQIIFKIQGANVIASMSIRGRFMRRGTGDTNAIAVSTTNGLSWKDVWASRQTGRTPVELNLVEEVSGAYEVLVRVVLKAESEPRDSVLENIAFRTVTMLNSKTQPTLQIGKNTVYVGAGDQTDSIVLWPDLQGGGYKPYVVEERNMATRREHPGYMGVMYAEKGGQEAYVIFRVDAPTDIVRIVYGGRFYNRAPKSHIDLLHSLDEGRTWRRTWSLTDTNPPWDVIHYETTQEIPAAIRSVLFKYVLSSPAAGTDACSIYAVRMEVNHRGPDTPPGPVAVTFRWNEVQQNRSLVPRSNSQIVTSLPCRYAINVGGSDHPVMDSVAVASANPGEDVKSGYSDGRDVGGGRYVGRRARYGRNLALAKRYTVSVPSRTPWGAGDPDGVKLTDGIVGPPYAGGVGPGYALCWDKGDDPIIDVDLGEARACGGFRVHLSGGWPWWDVIKGEVEDAVEVLTSRDGKKFTSRGSFNLNLRRVDVPFNRMMPDDETATGFLYDLVVPEAVDARYVRFRVVPQRTLTISEVQVLDSIEYEPFDLRIALPDD